MSLRYLVTGSGAFDESISVGDYVYALRGYDYGCASDDSRMTGVEHVSVTLNKFGGYPSFTIPKASLGEPELIESVYPDADQVQEICKMGQGAACCRYLTLGAEGFSCEKHSTLKFRLDDRAATDQMTAKSDNCEGMDAR